jgi:hypothetical protein
LLGSSAISAIPAGIIRDRTKRIERHDHTRQRQHGGGRNRDTEETRQHIGQDDAGNDDQIAGSAVDSSETARPWMTFVPCPETDASATERTGRYSDTPV